MRFLISGMHRLGSWWRVRRPWKFRGLSGSPQPAGRPITVAIPIYNAFEELGACLASLIGRQEGAPHRVLLIDDASPDERIWPLLQDFARGHAHVTALRNETNRGYTATVNRACAACEGDIVLLNSDTIVTDGWLKKLAACACSRPRVATVTPLSNAAGPWSVPVTQQINPVPPALGADGMAALVERLSERLWPEVPTGNGFCLYLRREALDATGWFDAANFPRGYGEENDFCLRASALGFVHLTDDTTFVAHRRSASFGEQKGAILAESKKTLRRLHPEYGAKVTAWLQNDPLDGLRGRLQQALAEIDAADRTNVLPSQTLPL